MYTHIHVDSCGTEHVTHKCALLWTVQKPSANIYIHELQKQSVDTHPIRSWTFGKAERTQTYSEWTAEAARICHIRQMLHPFKDFE